MWYDSDINYSEIPEMKTPFVIGSNVLVNLYNKGVGVVCAIHGSQRPDTIKSVLGGVGISGGNASVDIVFADGTMFKNSPEGIAHNYPRLDNVSTQDEILELVANYNQVTKAKEIQAKIDKDLFEAEVERIKQAPEYSHLDVNKKTAQNIRADLKKHYPKIKFSVTSDHNSVNIRYVSDKVSSYEVEKLLAKFTAGSFDGSDDSYHYSNTAFSKVFSTIKYIFADRTFTNEHIQLHLDKTNEKCGTTYTLDDYNNGNIYDIRFNHLFYNSMSR